MQKKSGNRPGIDTPTGGAEQGGPKKEAEPRSVHFVGADTANLAKDPVEARFAAQNAPATPMRGMRVVAEALRNEDFPMEKRDIDYSVGDIEVEDGRGGYVPVRDLTDKLKRESFDTAESVVKALQAILNEQRSRAA